jgi:hypothetical protein
MVLRWITASIALLERSMNSEWTTNEHELLIFNSSFKLQFNLLIFATLKLEPQAKLETQL